MRSANGPVDECVVVTSGTSDPLDDPSRPVTGGKLPYMTVGIRVVTCRIAYDSGGGLRAMGMMNGSRAVSTTLCVVVMFDAMRINMSLVPLMKVLARSGFPCCGAEGVRCMA